MWTSFRRRAYPWGRGIIRGTLIAIAITAVLAVFTENPEVAAPFVAFSAGLFYIVPRFGNKLERRIWKAVASRGMSLAALLWLTTAANESTGNPISAWDTLKAWAFVVGIVLTVVLPVAIVASGTKSDDQK